ncbi:hypothetical protein B1R94_26025 [Mycolicibacterium litorale]|nr:hypothetical protein B1R94_26025 [Mycolicibacterium litorale]
MTAAAATVVVALINGRLQRRDIRDNLKRDIELAKQLEAGSTSKIILEDHIAFTIDDMVRGERTRGDRVPVYILLLASLALWVNASVKKALDTHRPFWDISEAMTWWSLCIIVPVFLVSLGMYSRAVSRHNKRQTELLVRKQAPVSEPPPRGRG